MLSATNARSGTGSARPGCPNRREAMPRASRGRNMSPPFPPPARPGRFRTWSCGSGVLAVADVASGERGTVPAGQLRRRGCQSLALRARNVACAAPSTSAGSADERSDVGGAPDSARAARSGRQPLGEHGCDAESLKLYSSGALTCSWPASRASHSLAEAVLFGWWCLPRPSAPRTRRGQEPDRQDHSQGTNEEHANHHNPLHMEPANHHKPLHMTDVSADRCGSHATVTPALHRVPAPGPHHDPRHDLLRLSLES